MPTSWSVTEGDLDGLLKPERSFFSCVDARKMTGGCFSSDIVNKS